MSKWIYHPKQGPNTLDYYTLDIGNGRQISMNVNRCKGDGNKVYLKRIDGKTLPMIYTFCKDFDTIEEYLDYALKLITSEMKKTIDHATMIQSLINNALSTPVEIED